jgi:hypothetical protein
MRSSVLVKMTNKSQQMRASLKDKVAIGKLLLAYCTLVVNKKFKLPIS